MCIVVCVNAAVQHCTHTACKVSWQNALFCGDACQVWENNWHQQEFQRSGRNELQWGEQHFILTRRINEVTTLVWVEAEADAVVVLKEDLDCVFLLTGEALL